MDKAILVPRTTDSSRQAGCWWPIVSEEIVICMRCPRCDVATDMEKYEIRAGSVMPEFLCRDCGFFSHVHLQEWF